ncbi:uncharacterized protein UTRI_10247 [Ustilago trichophora]|uniref:Uncharacterized protein n=1 Tax=Ustilago trichophora TaxID=86804 RepID=A0A5C3EJI6_9BASI|nr:uncharacterized protein UTRI_10247 [Ustilago trichophora]
MNPKPNRRCQHQPNAPMPASAPSISYASSSQPSTTSPRRAHLNDILSQHIDRGDRLRKHWLESLDIALDPATTQNERTVMLDAFLDHPRFQKLLTALQNNISRLPPVLVERIFVSLSTLATGHQPKIRPRCNSESLLEQLDKLKLHLEAVDDTKRLYAVLFHSFLQPAQRTTDISLLAAHPPAADFTNVFQGPGLDLLVDHILVHNQLFPAIRIQNKVYLDSQDVPYRPKYSGQHNNSNSIITSTSVPQQSAKSDDTTRQYYAKVLPVIQSSGFGKTRMCVQLSTISPGMLVCLRTPSRGADETQVSFPPQDAQVYKYFQATKAFLSDIASSSNVPTKKEEHEAFNKAHIRILSWLAQYCEIMAAYLGQFIIDSGCFHGHQFCPSQDSDLCWRTALFFFADASSLSPRALFKMPDLCPYSNLFIRYQQPLTVHKLVSSLRTEILDQICETAAELNKSICKQAESRLSDPNLLLDVVSKHLKPRLAKLEQLPPKTVARPFNFLALDECGSMSALLPIIRRVWFHADPSCTWILLIDTNSDLAPLAGQEARQGSRRTGEFDTHRLTQPFSAMPLDVNFTFSDHEQLSDATSLSMYRLNTWLPKLGRPLWNDVKYHVNGIINARAIIGKLVWPSKASWPTTLPPLPTDDGEDDKQHLPTSYQNLLALASRRIHLELTSKAGPALWYQFVSRQIAHHLRFVGRIYSTSDCIVSNTPSEPPLSAAAAWFFRMQPDLTAARWALVIQAIAHASGPVGVNIGAQGEHAVALLCTVALDLVASCRYARALQPLQKLVPSVDTSTKCEALFGLVTVTEWLQMLAGSRYVEVVDKLAAASTSNSIAGGNCDNDAMPDPDCHPDDDMDHDQAQGLPSALTAWTDHAWINFKHIVTLPNQVPQDKPVDTDLFCELWLRHAAAQGIVNQKGWDFIIPVYHHDGGKPPIGDDILFDKDKLSYVAIQVKNCIDRPDRATRDAAVGPHLALSQDKQCLELFIDAKAPEHARGHKYSQRCFALPLSGQAGREASTLRPPPPPPKLVRHHIYMRGVSATSFPVLGQLDASANQLDVSASQLGASTSQLVQLLFGNADSIDTLEFDQQLTKYVRKSSSKNKRQAWQHAQVRTEGGLVPLSAIFAPS